MPYNGSGQFQRVYSWQTDANNGIGIVASRHDTEDDGIATGLSTAICKDGQTTITANLPMAGFRHTGVGNSSARTMYAVTGQIQDGSYLIGGSVSGTDTITMSVSPAIEAYAAGQVFYFVAAGTNTGATTININSVGAKAIQKNGSALVAGDITANDGVAILYDGTQFQMISPARTPVLTSGAIGPSALSTSATYRFGAVGINKANSTDKLEVNGAIRAEGASANFSAGAEGAVLDYSGSVVRVGHINGAAGSAKAVDFLSGGTSVGRIQSRILEVFGAAAGSAAMRLYEDTDNGTNYVGFVAPESIASDIAWTLPSADGTTNQAIVTNASGTLSFASIFGVKLGTATASASSSLTFTGLSSTYKAYVFVFEEILPATDGAIFLMRTSTNGGSSYDSGSGNYSNATLFSTGASGGNATGLVTTAVQLTSDVDTGAGPKINGYATIYSPASASVRAIEFKTVARSNDASATEMFVGCGSRDTAADVDAVQFIMDSGNIASGTIHMYGIL